MKLLRQAVAIAACVSVGACATVTRGPSTNWQVSTNPVGASVRTSNGRSCEATPCTLRMPRRARFTATISKPGYQPVDVKVDHEISETGALALAGNLIVGGILGIAVDLYTGAPNNLTPRDVSLVLHPGFATAPSGAAAVSASAALRGAPLARFEWARQERREDSPPRKREGRVLELKVMPDGSVRETRFPED